MKVLLSQEEMRAEVFRALRPAGVVEIHWGSEWCLDSASGRRGIVRVRAVFRERAPDNLRRRLKDFAHVIDTQPHRFGDHSVEFELMYARREN